MKHRNKRIRMTMYMAVASILLLTGFTGLTTEETQADPIPVIMKESGMTKEVSSRTGDLRETLFEDTKAFAEKSVKENLERIEQERIKAEQERLRKLREESETKLLAALIYCEAGNQPYEGKVAVGAVVMNRIKSRSFPNTMRGVIYQRGQFTPAMTGKLDSVLASGRYTKSCMDAAIDALNGSNPIGDYLFFNCGGSGMKLGDHYFH